MVEKYNQAVCTKEGKLVDNLAGCRNEARYSEPCGATKYNTPTPALCRSGYTWPEATIKQNAAVKRTFGRVVSGPKICPGPQASA